MALSIWTKRSGYSFGTIEERSQIDWQLPVQYSPGFEDSTNVSFKIIAGSLPPGLRLVEDRIVGTPYEVPRLTEFKFVIRAKYAGQLSDRTFYITIDGADQPTWLTQPGALPVGANQAYYILDNSFIDFQLEVIDYDTAAGQKLNFFVSSKEGELPPGLILTSSGRITGWIQPLLSVQVSDGNGFYDTGAYDGVAFDFGFRSSNGYDSYVYDLTNYDYFSVSGPPKKLNRNYEFIVTVTDGDTVVKRKFRIFVVGEDFFRSDTTVMQAGTGVYTADVTYVRKPIWITPNDLGIRRANNYQTIRLDIYEIGDPWPVGYVLEPTNPDGSLSKLPNGLQFDPSTAEVYGAVPYQPAVTKTYTFSVTAIRYSDTTETVSSTRTFKIKILGEVESIMAWVTDNDLGTIETNIISTLSVKATSTIQDSIILYKLEPVNPDGTISWLPFGLNLALDGEIIGKPNQFGTLENPGLIFFDGGNLIFDGGTTTVDRTFQFTITAADNTGFSAITRTFRLALSSPNDRLYSNLIVKPFLKPDQRNLFRSFITNSDIFDYNAIYRPNDPNFGLQYDLKMLVFAGIETKSAAEVVGVIGRNHRPKRFKLGDIKKAQAKIPGTNTLVYEVIYLEVIDPIEDGKTHLGFTTQSSPNNLNITVDQSNDYYDVYNIELLDNPQKFFGPPQPFNTSADRNDLMAFDPATEIREPSSILIWRKRIRELGLQERHYMPLWMRTVQDGSVQELDFVKAIPLCYCKPGMADDILLNIKNYFSTTDFSFNQIDYVIDRYIIDSVTGYSADKYIVFRNDRTTIT